MNISEEIQACKETVAAVKETVTRKVKETERNIKGYIRQRLADDEDAGREPFQSQH